MVGAKERKGKKKRSQSFAQAKMLLRSMKNEFIAIACVFTTIIKLYYHYDNPPGSRFRWI